MRTSQLFTRTSKNVPADEVSKNAKLLIRAGYIHKEMAGVYDYLPLGRKVLNNIIQIIREEMDSVGGQELFMSTLQPPTNWENSGRWHDDVIDVWFKTRMHSGKGSHMGPELGLGNTHEEALTALMRNFVHSYKDLPIYPYQFQTKFRNELRSKSGIMRCREFLMKDLYSFSQDKAQHDIFYEKMKEVYLRIFDRLGLGDITYLTFASGGSFSKFSHEFQTITDVGEDTIYVNEAKRLAINKEVYNDSVLSELGFTKDELIEKRAVEVGNIFSLGTKFSKSLGLRYTTEEGTTEPVFMGSYGIGPGRVMGTIVEHFSDERGIIWPYNLAPYKITIVRLGDNKSVVKAADKLYEHFADRGIDAMYDDRDIHAGEKFADADLLGIPYRVVVSEKTVKEGKFEFKPRSTEKVEMLDFDAVTKRVVTY